MSPEERREYFKTHRDEFKGPRPNGAPLNGDPEAMKKRREQFMKGLGIDPKELENLSPQERQAKIKESMEKRTTELEKKKADGTITDEEKNNLERLTQMKKSMGQRRDGFKKDGGEKSDKPEEKKPDDKK
jgi:hypothetical protein